MEIIFSNQNDRYHYKKLIEPLKEILSWLDIYLSKSKAMRLIYTSIYRPYDEERAKGRSGIHGLYRAVDVVIHEDGREFDQADYDRMAYLLNITFAYGDNKHQICVSAPHGTGKHLHIQARPETHKRTEGEM